MRYRSLSLACALGMSTLLFAGCGNNDDNNGINARSVNPGNSIRNANDLGTNRNGAGNGNWMDRTRIAGFGSAGLGTDGLNNDGADGVHGTDNANDPGNRIAGRGITGRSGSNGDDHSAGSGTSGNGNDNSTPSGGAYGIGDLSGQLRNLGVQSSDVLLLGNLMIVGVHPQGQNPGNSVNGSGTMGSTGGNGSSSGSAGSGTTASNRTGATGTNGSQGANGSNGTGATGTNGTNGSAAAPGTGTNASSDSSDQMLRTYFGRQYRVMKVSDRKALQAMERVRRNLYTASSIRNQSLQLVQDLHYIVSKATDVSSHPGTASRSGSSDNARAYRSSVGTG